MPNFFQALFEYAFLQNALLVAWLASLACGIVGTYVVVRRISYLAGAIAHCALGGIGFARYMQVVHGWSAFTPLLGALFAALIAAWAIGVIQIWASERVDTAISALWGLGMASGILFMARTPGYATDLMGYIFGNILLATPQDLFFIALLDGVILLLVLLFHKSFSAVCFDEEFARLRGLPARALYLLLLLLVALTVVLLVSVVGIIMVIILLTLPAALAGRFTHRLLPMMGLATLFCAFATSLGLGLSYQFDLPAGAIIIFCISLPYLLTLVLKSKKNGSA